MDRDTDLLVALILLTVALVICNISIHVHSVHTEELIKEVCIGANVGKGSK